MSPTDLADYFETNPGGPYRLTLASGDQIIVQSDRHALVADATLALAVTDDPAKRLGRRLKLISIPNIVMIEQIEQNRPGRRRRS